MGNTRCWTEINTSALAHNTRTIKTLIGKKTKLCAVVKANAYGHGAFECAEIFFKNGAEMFAVATYEEALELREIGAPVLILGFVPKNFLPDAIRQNFHLCCYSMSVLEDIQAAAKQEGTRAKIHIKFDTGLTRLGFSPQTDITPILANKNLEVEGIFSHLASADLDDKSYSLSQLKKFSSIEKASIPTHLTNTAGTARFPNMRMNMVRVGLALYGYEGFPSMKLGLTPAMSLKAKVVDIKIVPPGTHVSYNGTYTTSQTEQIAVIAAGYADGYPHRLSNKSQILIGGKLHQQVGYICMDYCMARLEPGNNVNIGDTATLMSSDIPASTLADLTETNTHSILTGITPRAKKVYL